MNARIQRQARGSVLIVALVILLVLTLLGISGMNTTTLQERMVGNLQEGLSSFQAAEAGLRYGEVEALQEVFGAAAFVSDCTNGLCQPADPATDSYDVWVQLASLVVWDASDAAADVNTRQYGDVAAIGNDLLQDVSRQPAYILEKLYVVERGGSIVVGESAPEDDWFRVTARGFGRHGQSQTTLQSVVRR